jgi:hypothetical protein
MKFGYFNGAPSKPRLIIDKYNIKKINIQYVLNFYYY